MKDWLDVPEIGDFQGRVKPSNDISFASGFFNDVEAKYRNIPSDTLGKLCEIYYWDFTLFSYELPSFC